MESNSFQKNKKFDILKKIELNDNITLYQIQNKDDGNIYYIKKIKLKDESDEELNKITNEFKILSDINSEYVVKYTKSTIKNNYFIIVIDFYEELSLRQLINKYKKENEFIKQKNIFLLIKYICMGIKAIHDKRIIHGNLTPDNIFITKEKKTKIGNFAIFKNLNCYNDYLESNNIDNKNYNSPEMIKGENLSNKTDIWSFGCIIYELCSLEYCFYAENISCLNHKIMNEKNPKINLKLYEHDIQNLIDSMLKKDPNERPNIDEIYSVIINYCENKKNKKCEENEIKIILEITNEDIEKEIYFLDNSDYFDEKGNKHYHDSLKEFNDIKVDLFIDNKKLSYKKYNKFYEAKKYEIILKFNSYIKDCSKMFYNCKNIKNIDLSKFNTKNVINADDMFYNCENIININLSKFNTKNMKTMKNMFYNCSNLLNLDLISFDTQNVINMSGMFDGCEKLEKLNLLNFDTGNVTDMNSLFKNCSKLSEIDLSKINTSKVKNMSRMFYMCENLKKLDLSQFDTKNVENMDEMFSFCIKLTNPIITSFCTPSLKSVEGMFNNCSSLINLDLSTFNTDIIENMCKMFYGCKNLEYLNISNFNMNKVKQYYQMFFDCSYLKAIKIKENNTILTKTLKDENINPEIILSD